MTHDLGGAHVTSLKIRHIGLQQLKLGASCDLYHHPIRKVKRTERKEGINCHIECKLI